MIMATYQELTHTNNEFINELKRCIKNELPLSLCRIGDGEINIFNKRTSDPINRFWKNWGYNSADEMINESRKMLMDCIKMSDWIGCVGYTDFMKTWHQDRLKRPKWYLDLKFVNESGRKKPLKTVDAFIPRTKSLGDVNELKKILQGKDICIISPLNSNLKKNNLSKKLGCKITYIDVPYRSKIEHRNQILNKIENIKEHVILTSWTLLGKDFHHKLFNQGKVCLDMGSVISAWAGKEIRWDFREGGPHRHCVIK